MKSTIAGLSVLIAATFINPGCLFAAENWILKESPHSVEKTADNLVAVIEKAPPTLFARIDHAAGAKKAGLELEPTTLVIFGNPKIGTPIMRANRKAAMDLPTKILIWSEGGKTTMGALAPEGLKARYGIEDARKSFEMMGGALGKLMEAAAK
ncbi:MAG: DUF302 domain-containing protein [Rhizobiaceae bacterium]